MKDCPSSIRLPDGKLVNGDIDHVLGDYFDKNNDNLKYTLIKNQNVIVVMPIVESA